MRKRVTYSQLGKVLASLGFEKIEGERFTAFRNSTYDAVIMLPKGNSETMVSPAHFLTIEKTVTGKGIIPLERFRTIWAVRRPRTARVIAIKGSDEPVSTQDPVNTELSGRRKSRIITQLAEKETSG